MLNLKFYFDMQNVKQEAGHVHLGRSLKQLGGIGIQGVVEASCKPVSKLGETITGYLYPIKILQSLGQNKDNPRAKRTNVDKTPKYF